MEYILGVKQGACIFCDFASAPPAAYREKLVLLVQPHALVCLNRYPFSASHLLVAPRRHVSDLGELPTEEYDALMHLLRDACTRLRASTGAEGLNVGFNLGKAAGAGIADHLHAHAVPRWNGDVNFMPVLADVRVMPEHLDTTWQRMAPLFADLPGEHPETPPPHPPPRKQGGGSADTQGG
jgi:ATP adenylyltransferase